MLKSEIIKLIENEYKQKQQRLNDLRFKSFAENMSNPLYQKLEKAKRAINLELLSSPSPKLEELLKKVIKKQESISNNEFAEKFECNKCKDTGLHHEKYCECFNRKLNELLIKESGVPTEMLRRFSDSDFSKFENSEGIKKVYEIFESLVKNLNGKKYKNFIIQGDSGVGKTFLLSCIAGEIIEKGHTLFFVTAFNLNQLMVKYHTNFSADREKFLAPVFDSDVLIIDDLGTEQILKNVTLEYFLEILKTRVLNSKHTFISTNLDHDQLLDRYGERIFSRILDKSNSLAIKLSGENLRLKK